MTVSCSVVVVAAAAVAVLLRVVVCGGGCVSRSWWSVEGKVEERRTCVVYCRSGRPGPGFRVLTFYSFLEWTIVAAVKDQHPDDDGDDERNGLGLFNGKSFRFSSSHVRQSLASIVPHSKTIFRDGIIQYHTKNSLHVT